MKSTGFTAGPSPTGTCLETTPKKKTGMGGARRGAMDELAAAAILADKIFVL